MLITLYGRPFNRSDRVQWTLEELGVEYQYRKLDVFGLEHRDPELREKYALSRLPFVEIDGRVMFESGAIMLFLAETFRGRCDLLPRPTDDAYGDVLQWLFFSVSTLEAADQDAEPGSEPAPSAPLQEVLGFLDGVLASRQFIAADRFTIADIALATGLQWIPAKTRDAFPQVEGYYERQRGRAAHQRLLAETS